jgi:outer membrane protein assembly factor BamB
MLVQPDGAADDDHWLQPAGDDGKFRAMKKLPHFCVMFAVSTLGSAAADQWPQWRGPLANGVASAGDPPIEWSETKNLRWKSAIPGRGTSTPVIWGDQLFILAAQPKAGAAPAAPKPANPEPPLRSGGGGGGGFGIEKPQQEFEFFVHCFDRQTGKIQWTRTVATEIPHEGHHRDHGFASASPVTDGQHVYSYFGSRGLYCHDLQGNLKWKKRFGQMSTRNSFGEGSSPGLHGNTLVVLWDHEGDDFVVALDKQTGNELWRQKRDEATGWTTPLFLKRGEGTEVVLSATGKIRSYDLADGKLRWECAGMTANAIPTPVAGDDLVYCISGFRGSALLAIKRGQSGDLTGTEAIAWSHKKNTPYVPSPLLYENNLYFFSVNSAMLSCLNAKTGRPHYEVERLPEISGVYASPVGAAGRVYVAGRDGKCAVLKAGPKFEVLAQNTLADKFDASPAVIGNDLYLRGHQNLYCIGKE